MRFQGAGFRVQGSGFRVQGAGFRVQGLGGRVQGAGCRVHGVGCRVQGREWLAPDIEGDSLFFAPTLLELQLQPLFQEAQFSI